MANAIIDICNLALDYCNERNITDIDENTKNSNKCRDWYDIVRQSLLMNLNASFSIKRAVLSQNADVIPVYGYTKAYALPYDVLQVLNVGNPADDIYYQIEKNLLYCNENIDPVEIRYIADITDVSEFDAEFVDLFALKLAEKICMPLTEDLEKTNYLKQLAAEKYIECSTKYGRDNRIILINNLKYRNSKCIPQDFPRNYNYPVR